MKANYVPLDKCSKRKKKEYYTKQRKDWGIVNPVTRSIPNLKAYNRKKSERWLEPGSDFLLLNFTLPL